MGIDFTQIFWIITSMPKHKKNFSWRILTQSKKTRKSMKRTLLAGLLFVLALGTIGGIELYKVLTKPFASAASAASFDIKDTQLVTLALVVVDHLDSDPIQTSSINLIFFDTEKKKVVSFDIPLEMEIDAPGRFGAEPYKNLMSLGDDGAETIRKSLKKQFGFSVDRYLVTEERYSEPVLETFKFGRSHGLLGLESLTGFALSSVTDASISEIYSLYTLVNSLPSDRFIVHENSEDFYADGAYINSVIRDLTFDSKVAQERASVAILNGTETTGVAGFGQRVVENLGGYVVSAGNASTTYAETTLIVDSKDLQVVKEILRFFPVKNVIEKRAFANTEPVADRVDVSLIIGLDTAGDF